MFQATDRVGVHIPDEPAGSELVVRLHPSGNRARGLGYEEDTAKAIAWLTTHVQPGMSVADIGTGTGILAIVASLLGGVVTAYEQDTKVRVFAAANIVISEVEVELRGEYDNQQGFDIVVANLGDVDYFDILTAGVEVWTSAPANPRWHERLDAPASPELVELPDDVAPGDIVRNVVRPEKVREWLLGTDPHPDMAVVIRDLPPERILEVWTAGVAQALKEDAPRAEKRGIVRRFIERLRG